ncbi:hypothetical protein ACFL27_27765, partial [candidate division CSSED10-310 bacterium]
MSVSCRLVHYKLKCVNCSLEAATRTTFVILIQDGPPAPKQKSQTLAGIWIQKQELHQEKIQLKFSVEKRVTTDFADCTDYFLFLSAKS